MGLFSGDLYCDAEPLGAVALALPIGDLFDYPCRGHDGDGQRVRVPFKAKKVNV